MMNKHTSVFLFLIRNKLYKAVTVLLAMAAVSLLGFRFLGFLHAPFLGANHGAAFLGVVCLLGYIGCILACLEFPTSKSKHAYTYQRLLVTEKEIFFWDALSNILFFLLFYAAEILILFTLARQYAASADYAQGSQGVLLAFYRNAFLHGMVPMAETGIWIRNLIYILATGVFCASSSLNVRYNAGSFRSISVLAVLVALRFPMETGRETYILSVGVVILAVLHLVSALNRAHTGGRRPEPNA